jgi:hypothetical protein
MAAALSDPMIRDEVKEKDGVCVYVYNVWHILRANGFMSVYNMYGRTMPYYALLKDGSVKCRGDFTTGRPFLSMLFLLLHKTRLASFFKIEIPRVVRDSHIDLVCGLIKHSKVLFNAAFPRGRFYVLFHPYHAGEAAQIARIKEFLQQQGIPYFSYPGLYDPDEAAGSKHIIPGDGHPNAYANKKLAAKLAADISAIPDIRKER